MQLEAQILQDAVQASASREWGKASGQPTALCPICAVPRAAHEANKNGRVLWKWRATGDTQQNKREPALNVGKVFFPLDEELGLLEGESGSPTTGASGPLGEALMPFAKAAQMIE